MSIMDTMTPKERLKNHIEGKPVDRIPLLGGWMNGVRNLADLAGITPEDYLKDPEGGVVQANVALGVDAMVFPVVPKTLDEVRSGSVTEAHFKGREPEEVEASAAVIPDTEEELLKDFDPKAHEANFRSYFEHAASHWAGMEAIPNFWDLGGHFALYHQYGYEAFLMACALYPEAVGKIWWSRSVVSRERAKILAPLYRELDLVPLLFCGEDLCNNSGPMVSVDFLREHYFPHVRMALEPLVSAGVRVIHHCDGNIYPVLNDFLDAGFSGFQGFQYELDLDLRRMREICGKVGVDPLFFTGMSVTRTLPFGTEEDVRNEIDYFFDATDGGTGMFLFSSNVTGVEVKPDLLRAGYGYAAGLKPGAAARRSMPAWPNVHLNR